MRQATLMGLVGLKVFLDFVVPSVTPCSAQQPPAVSQNLRSSPSVGTRDVLGVPQTTHRSEVVLQHPVSSTSLAAVKSFAADVAGQVIAQWIYDFLVRGGESNLPPLTPDAWLGPGSPQVPPPMSFSGPSRPLLPPPEFRTLWYEPGTGQVYELIERYPVFVVRSIGGATSPVVGGGIRQGGALRFAGLGPPNGPFTEGAGEIVVDGRGMAWIRATTRFRTPYGWSSQLMIVNWFRIR